MFLKSMLLSSVRPFYAPDDDKGKEGEAEKTDVEKRKEARDAIAVVTSKQTEQQEEEKKDDEEIEEKEEEKEPEKEEEKEEEEAPDLAKLQKTVERLQKRLDKTTGKNKDLEKELNTAKAALEAKKAEGETVLTEADVEARAEQKALQLAAERKFADDCKKLFDGATKVDKKFKDKIDSLAEEVSPIPSLMIGVLSDLDNGGEVLSYLADNPDDYERIYTLNPAKMGIELDRIATKIEEKKKKPHKPISKVPAPTESVNGSRQVTNQITDADTKDMSEYVRKRRIQMEEKRKGMR